MAGATDSKTHIPTLTCTASNVVYCINCQCCGQQYIGETKCKIRIRAREHMADIRNINNKQPTHATRGDKPPIRPKPVAVHCNSEGHCLKDFKFQILEMLPGEPEDEKSTKIQRDMVSYWIHHFRPLHPGVSIYLHELFTYCLLFI